MSVVVQPGDHVWAVFPVSYSPDAVLSGESAELAQGEKAANERVVRSWQDDCPGVQFGWVNREYNGPPSISFVYRPPVQDVDVSWDISAGTVTLLSNGDAPLAVLSPQQAALVAEGLADALQEFPIMLGNEFELSEIRERFIFTGGPRPGR